MASPLKQFEVQPIVDLQFAGLDVSFTNSSLMLTLIVLAIVAFFTFGLRGNSVVPTKMQALIEMFYEFISNMLKDNIGPEGKKFFPLIFSIFLLILGANIAGMMPYAFTVTSHIAVNFAFALFCFLIINIVGFARHGLKFLKLFVPKDVPIVILPIISVIEVISYLIRPFTLAIRLSAAMTAGHIVMKVFAGFIISLGSIFVLLGAVPLAFSVALVALELLVAFLQAFIFSILVCIYLNDAVNMH